MMNMEDWQASRGVLECNKYMLDNAIETDVEFMLENENGTKESVKAHKYMLMSRSPVFFAMLCGPMAEKQGADISVPDISPSVFRQLLSFVYCETVEMSAAETALPLIYAAKKYMLPSLVTRAIDFLETMLSPENVCSVLEQSLLFDEDPLRQKCLRIIQSHSQCVFESASFLRISMDTLVAILQVPCFSVSELVVFQACVSWSQHQCKEAGVEVAPAEQRRLLGEALYHVRLPTISLKEFSNHVTPTGILTDREALDIFQYLAADDPHRPTDLPFSMTPRKCEADVANLGPLRCQFRFDSKLDALYKKHSIVMINIDRKVCHVAVGLSFLPQTAGCVGRIVIGQDNNTVNLPYDSTTDKVSADIELFPGNFVIENYITQMRFRVGLPKFAMLLTRVDAPDDGSLNLSVVASDAFSVLPANIDLTLSD